MSNIFPIIHTPPSVEEFSGPIDAVAYIEQCMENYKEKFGKKE